METAAPAAVSITAEQLGLNPGEEFEGQLDFDLGTLLASDPSPQDLQALREDPEAFCLETATKITQSLAAQLFRLPGRSEGLGRIVDLPAPSFPLPRQKPMPTPRPPTRWEKFAQQKGIQKRKRSVKVWDEDQQEWRRRFGYQRAGDDRDIPIIEAGPNDEVGEDPFSKLQKEKADRVKSSDKRQLANAKHALKNAGKGAVPSTLKLAATLPQQGKAQPVKRKELHSDIRSASKQAGIATASMGKFDKRLVGEKPGERQIGSKRRKFEPAFGDLASERAQAAGAVDRILREKADDVIDMERAVNSVKRKIQKEPAVTDDDSERKKKKKGRVGPKKAPKKNSRTSVKKPAKKGSKKSAKKNS